MIPGASRSGHGSDGSPAVAFDWVVRAPDKHGKIHSFCALFRHEGKVICVCGKSMAAKSVRMVDASGAATNVGVLEVHVGSGAFGTVSGLNSAAADVACRELGTP